MVRGGVQRNTGERRGMWVLQSESGVNDENTVHSLASSVGLIDSRRGTRVDVRNGGGKTAGAGDCEDQPEKFVAMEWELSKGLAAGAEVRERC